MHFNGHQHNIIQDYSVHLNVVSNQLTNFRYIAIGLYSDSI